MGYNPSQNPSRVVLVDPATLEDTRSAGTSGAVTATIANGA